MAQITFEMVFFLLLVCGAAALQPQLGSNQSYTARVYDWLSNGALYGKTTQNYVVRVKLDEEYVAALSVPIIEFSYIHGSVNIPLAAQSASLEPTVTEDGLIFVFNWTIGNINDPSTIINVKAVEEMMELIEVAIDLDHDVFLIIETTLTMKCDREVAYTDFPVTQASDFTTATTYSTIAGLVSMHASHPCFCFDADVTACDDLYSQVGVNKDTLTRYASVVLSSQDDQTRCEGDFSFSNIVIFGYSAMVLLWVLDACIEGCCLPHEHRAASRRSWLYLLTGGCLDALTAPGQLLWNTDFAFYHAVAFCLIAPILAGNILQGHFDYWQAFVLQGLPASLHMCRRYRYPTVGAIMGLGYSAFLVALFLINMQCTRKYGLNLQWIQYVIPIVCSAVLLQCYSSILYRQLVHRTTTLSLEHKWRHLDRRAYVGRLLRDENPTKLKGLRHFFRGLISDSEYQLSPRVVSACCFGFSMVLTLCFFADFFSNFLAVFFEYFTSGGHCCSGKPCDPTPMNMLWTPDIFGVGIGLTMGNPNHCSKITGTVRDVLGLVVGVCGLLSAIAVFISAVYFLGSHRDHMLKMYKGYRNPVMKKPSPSHAILSTLEFSGAQIATMTVSWLLLTVVLVAFAIFLTTSTVLVIAGYLDDWFWGPIVLKKWIYDSEAGKFGTLPTMAINAVIMWLVATYLFALSGNYGINRQGLFFILDVIEALLYAINSLVGIVVRLLMSVFAQMVYLARLDRSLLPGSLDRYDNFFKVYVAYSYVEHYHTHPVFVTALYFLLAQPSAAHTFIGLDNQPTTSPSQRQRVRNRWQLLLTLVNNPDLVALRIHNLEAKVVDPTKMVTQTFASQPHRWTRAVNQSTSEERQVLLPPEPVSSASRGSPTTSSSA